MDKTAAEVLPSQAFGAVHTSVAHESAARHVSGTAVYIDDMPEPAGLLHAYLALSNISHGMIRSLDLSAIHAAPGVVGVLTASDIPGLNDMSAMNRKDEPILAKDKIEFDGQALFAVIAQTREQARRACALAKIDYDERPAEVDFSDVDTRNGKLVTEPLVLTRGDTEAEIASAPHSLSGEIRIGGQEHFYLEGQIAMAMPNDGDEITVYSSTQYPAEVQRTVAHALNVPFHAVEIHTRRMGGAFGGKETQATQFAAIAALAAQKFNKPIKIRPDRDDDMRLTGKRHDFNISYRVGFDDDGRIRGVDYHYALRCGYSADLSGAVADRALLHCDNTYYYPAVHAVSAPLYTNTASNTAFRGFGGPQGVLGCERVMEEIAFALGKDPLEVRKANFYGTRDRNITPYRQQVEDNIIGRLVRELEKTSEYVRRRREIRAFNTQNRFIKRGLALVPVKFGMSFTNTNSNQAGALLHVYTDGSVQINHGGTEMGQGLYIKVAQVVAQELNIDISQIKATATTTGKVPNASATAGSTGSDLNGMAARDAAIKIRKRLAAFAAKTYGGTPDDVAFLPGCVQVGSTRIAFADLVKQAQFARVQLSATGFYKTPKISWDRAKAFGKPYYYFAYGASCSEVSIDTLTGEYIVERVDILHDAGKSLNMAIDIGQIEGGFIQGMGWLTTEELIWDRNGFLRTHAPSTYKIPLASDRPKIFNVALTGWSRNHEAISYRSKGVGEPPLLHGISVLHALSDAVASVANHRICPRLDAPATPERVLMAIERLRAQSV
ncbi:xanthine dehydrogenase molybdopterin binding subunit [Afipia carboxidovorans]|uniref:xanthine dehydrogenase molybdopterin binding subunit n=1 Tax=Afipia carboxidovorans TaxID=40137 RepID=UPI0030876C2D|nr:xanthine dehydrogenase molybdopterin binding subunit [Afipia carboxidovorans]